MRQLKATFIRPVPPEYAEAFDKLRDMGVDVQLYAASPNLDYGVPAPFLRFRGEKHQLTEYGFEDGLALIDEVLNNEWQ